MADKVSSPLRVGVIGAGVLGRALVRGVLESGTLSKGQMWASTQSESSAAEASAELGIQVVTDYSSLLGESDVVVLAVKPNKIAAVCQKLPTLGLSPQARVISVAAGVRTSVIHDALGTANPILRAMPNTAALIREATTVICRGPNSELQHQQEARQLFEPVGKVFELSEDHFDAVTALGGSGPAFIYLMMEALADGGVNVGLPRQTATDIVAQVVLGSARMLQYSERHPAALKDDVTTPAGCTIAAILTMEDGRIRSVLARAVEEATRRAAGLG